jgi:hypothetical protein
MVTRLTALSFVILAQLALVLADSPPAEALARCRVNNSTIGRLYVGGGPNLQQAILEAPPGSVLNIRGRCVGTFSINKALILVGRRTTGAPLPTLDAMGGGAVLTTGNQSNVIVRDLRITGGTGFRRQFGGSLGGGIANRGGGLVILEGATRVSGNKAENGGGIWNAGTLILRDRAVVARNRGGGSLGVGGGIYQNRGVLLMRDSSSVLRNRASLNGGGVFHFRGEVVLRDHASVRFNSARNLGGGIYFEGARLTLKGSAQVTHNTAGAGGGIYDGIGNPIRVCSPSVAIIPNDPNDPPATTLC